MSTSTMSCEIKIKMLQEELVKRDATINSMLAERKSFLTKIDELEEVIRKLQPQAVQPLSDAEVERFRDRMQ